MNFVHGAEALFFVGVLIWIVRWIGRTMREISGSPAERPHGLARTATDVFEGTSAARYLAESGALSPAQLAAMSDRERDLLLRETAARLTSAASGDETAARRSGIGMPPAIVVHCPACGTRVADTPRALPFTDTCAGCARTISVRGDGPGRISVVMVEPRAEPRSESRGAPRAAP